MSRFAWFLLLLCAAAPVAAQEPDPAPVASIPYVVQPPPIAPIVVARPKRPSALVPLYAVFGGLQAADYASTMRAVASGAGREGNPLVEPMVGHPAAFMTLKAASTAGTIWAGEKIWRRNRVGAVVFMAVANGALAIVVAHNYAVARNERR